MLFKDYNFSKSLKNLSSASGKLDYIKYISEYVSEN